jgi:hypothetical protein
MKQLIQLVESAEQLDEINFKKAAATAGLIGALATGSASASEPIDLSQVIGQPITSAMQTANFNPFKDKRLSDFMSMMKYDGTYNRNEYPMASKASYELPSLEDALAYAEKKKPSLKPRNKYDSEKISQIDTAITILNKSKADYKPQVANYDIAQSLNKKELIPGIVGWSVDSLGGIVTGITNHFKDVYFFDYTDKITAKYGKPTSTKSETLQNAYGVQVENYIYTWEVDGLKIYAEKNLDLNNGYIKITSK